MTDFIAAVDAARAALADMAARSILLAARDENPLVHSIALHVRPDATPGLDVCEVALLDAQGRAIGGYAL